MDKRYQIFISSTFADLIEERKAIMEAILDLNGFPAGMEMFPANDSEQFEYIKTIIDESDYYVLVIAGRYGSLAEDGISYTEKEYDYAMEKGIPVLVFVRNDIENILVKNTDGDPDKKKKLEAFKNKAMKNKLAKYWETSDQLKYAVSSSLLKIFRTNPKLGWIRGNIESNAELLNQLNNLRQDYDKLNNINLELQKQNVNYNKYDIDTERLSSGDDKFNINYEYTCLGENEFHRNNLSITWNDIISILGPKLNDEKDDDELKEILEKGLIVYLNYVDDEYDESSEYIDWFKVSEISYNKVKIQLIALGIVQENSGYIVLTEKGYREMVNIMAIKK